MIDLSYELVNPPLLPGQGFSFGRGTRVHVEKSTIGAAELRTNDQPLSRQDGILMGREYLGGRTISFDINIKTRSGVDDPNLALQLWRKMAQTWKTEDVLTGGTRKQPGLLSELYIQDGDITYVTYGRPRGCQDTRGSRRRGWIPVTADFQTVTHKFYDSRWQSNMITTAPSSKSGFIFPITWPLTTIATFSEEDVVNVDGNTDTWMISRVYGPISSPGIEVVGYYTIQTSSDFTLGPYDVLEIDPRPWARKIMVNGTRNVAGKFTQGSRRPSVQTLPPGTHKIVLSGNDPTGTARLETRWRNAYTDI